MKARTVYLTAIVVTMLVGVDSVEAAPNTWLGVTTNWNNTGNWSLGWVPQAGDDVVVPNTAVKAYMPATNCPLSGAFTSFVVNNGATVYCLGDTNVINEASGGTAGTNHGVGVTIFTTDATINGILDANSLGFPNMKGPGCHTGGGGGSYGGLAGQQYQAPVYGSLRQPTALGSGGYLSAGGGAIRLVATGTLTVNGTIRANAIANYSGGGSGGSIWLTAATFTGTGSVQAAAGSTGGLGDRRGGAGGRIAIEYTTSTFSGAISAAGSAQGGAGTGYYGDGQAGTLWEPGKTFPTSGPLTVSESYQYYFPNTNTLYQWDLKVSNAWFEVHGGRVAVSNLTVYNSVFGWGQFAARQPGVSDMTNFTLAGNVTLTNTTNTISTALLMPAGVYSLVNLTVTTNCNLMPFPDTNAVNEASGGTSGSKHGQGVAIRCASARIDGIVGYNGVQGSGERYDYLGFPNFSGPGGTTYGGAYGGKGGSYNASTSGGTTYGRMDRPTALGSGGYLTDGGGAFKLRCDGTLSLGGVIDMRGTGSPFGGGAGGSVWLIANTLTGGGSVLASGGPSSFDPRGGGGGRVALEYGSASTYSGLVTAACGAIGLSWTGTVFNCQSVAPGATDEAGYAGLSLGTTFATNSFTNGLIVTRAITEWKPRTMTWTDRCTDGGSNQFNNMATNRLTGLLVNQNYWITDNSTPLFGGMATNSGASGTLQFVVTLDAQHTIDVRAPAAGTVIMCW